MAKSNKADAKAEDVKPDVLQDPAEQMDKLTAELAAVVAENQELKLQIEALKAKLAADVAGDKSLTPAVPAAQYAAGVGMPSENAEVVAIKSKHGYPFWRCGYRVLPEFTFVRRADFEAADFERLINDRLAVVREAVPVADE